MEGSGELQCVGRLEVAKPSKPVGFLCGTLPVPTDAAFPFTQSALVPTTQTVRAPRYQMLPTETDLNTLPLLPNIPEVVFPAATNTGDIYWENSSIRQDLSRKCEALAVSGLVEYGDEIDVVAPADILKQIFKIPYSKARLSIAVHRIGDTLILNAGPDVEEGEKMSRRQSSQSKGADPSIFLNFAVHSVRAEACDCPPTHCASEDQPSSTILPGHFGHREGAFVSSSSSNVANSQLLNTPKEGFSCPSEGNQEKFFWGTKQKQNKKRRDTTRKTSQVGEKPRCPVQESDKCRKVGNNGFLRVLFWQFHNFRMLLGSDLLLFSNDKYVAVSLHLWDVSRQVTPVTWLEAWLDNVMASVPELAICYHQNGVVQGYELLKTDDISLLKGISDDGTPAFHPQVVQQNGLSVLRFLQDNCKQDPGAYWLHKSAGEDVIQLYDLSVLPKNHSPDDHSKSSSLLPCQMHKARRDSLFSLGTLLNRIAHRLSLSKAPDNRAKCAQFFKKCLDFLGEPDHLVVRAYAHEQFARLILKCYEELDLISEPFLIESEVTVTDMEDESSVFSLGIFGSNVQDKVPSQSSDYSPSTKNGAAFQCSESEAPVVLNLEENLCVPRSVPTSETTEMGNKMGILPNSNIKDGLAMCQISASAPHVVQTVSDPISSKLAAIHHVSQAIKSLRWKRQLQNTGGDLIDHGSKVHDKSPPVNFSVCICGDADCIEVCDIREWLGKSKMDRKLWKLVLLLGESYLALGEAYKDDGKLHQALKVVELACSVYGSMPQHLEDDSFISSMVSSSPSQHTFGNGNGERNLVIDGNDLDSCFLEKCLPADQVSSSYVFWSKAWMLVGDVYVEFHRIVRSKDIQVQAERKDSGCALRMSNEVVREVKRLKKKLGRYKQNCSTCSLINCSCESDRASSGNSASSSSGDAHFVGYTRKLGRKSNMKKSLHSSVGSPEDGHVPCKMDYVNGSDYTCLQKTRERKKDLHDSSSNPDKLKISSLTGVEEDEAAIEIQHAEYEEAIDFQPTTKDASEVKHGGIFKFLEGPKVGDAEHNLSAAISCYDASCKALGGFPIGSAEVQSVFRKKGWVFNELGRCRLDSGDLSSAEHAFVDAIKAFKEVTDHTNIILINCNLGHGRRALAEEMVSKMEKLKNQTSFQSSYNQAMQRAKLEYSRSLGYYEAAKTELNAIGEGTDPVLRNEVYTQFAHTYLKLGMLLAREVISAEAFESGQFEELSIAQVHPSHDKIRDQKKYEISANDAFREAVSIYESLGELRKQEAAFAYFQLGCYHRDSYLKFLDLDRKQNNNRQKAKWYASLAERNWQKSIDFYGPKTHPVMYLNILLEQSALYLSLSSFPHSNAMLESALCHLLEGRHVVGETGEGFSCDQDPGISKKFWNQLQSLLKKMLAVALSGKSGTVVQGVTTNRAGDAAGKLKEMYGISLRSSGLDQLHVMYRVWMS